MYSLSAQDRETLERSKQAAAQAKAAASGQARDSNTGAGGSVAASAVANHAMQHHMEVDELERELSGRA